MSAEGDIDAIRRSLGFVPAQEELVRRAAPLLLPEIEGWVEAFYARLVVDEVAMSLLRDEATVIRLKRSLVAWFQELLSLPYDSEYERARAEIGRVHVQIGMPQHLMVTAMAGIRRDVGDSVARLFSDDPVAARTTIRALEQILDLELALMLGAYRRRARELAQRTDRAFYVQRAELRFSRARGDALDAALCYAELLRASEDGETRARWSARLVEALGTVARAPRSADSGAASLSRDAVLLDLREVVARALEEVSVPARTSVEVVVEPPDAQAVLHGGPFRLALEELLQNAVNRDPGGHVRLAMTALADGGLLLEIADGGPGWPEGSREVDEAVTAAGGVPQAFCELLTDLHGGTLELVRPPGGGAALRMRLRPVVADRVTP